MNPGPMFIIIGIGISILFLTMPSVNVQIRQENTAYFDMANAQGNQGNFFPSSASPTNPSLQSFNNTTPVVSRLSHEGLYEVQVLWSEPQNIQSPNILPKKGFDMHIEFLDPNAPNQTERVIGEHNLISDELRPVPVIKSLLPVENYDIALISASGDILWNQENKSPSSGRAFERVILDEPYEGNITISVTDIRSSMTGLIDSVQLPVVLS
jgi:hypothetical protein